MLIFIRFRIELISVGFWNCFHNNFIYIYSYPSMYILFFSLNFYLYFVLDIMVHNTNKEHKSRLCFLYIPKLILHLRLNHNNSDYIFLNLSQKQYAESHYNTAGSNIGRFSFTNSCTFPECSKESENEILGSV